MKFQNYKTILLSITSACLFSTNTPAMLKALNTAATGMAAQEAHVNNVSNNIANLNTIAFKKSRTETEDLMYETITESGARSSATTRYNVGVQIGTGSKVSAVRKNFSQGSPKITNNPFDLMINGDGFFAIILPNNEVQYTRDGSFNLDEQGNIVTKQGYKLFPGIVVPSNIKSINISRNGNVDAYFNNQPEPNNLGNIPIFNFINPVGLKSAGNNLYLTTLSSGNPSQGIAGTNNSGFVIQGNLEISNVNIMAEMTDLIKAQRAYELNAKVMGVADQMLQTVNNIR